MQKLDLFDQQENRSSGRAKLVIAVGNKTRAPGAELLDLALVQTIAQRSTSQGLGQCTTADPKDDLARPPRPNFGHVRLARCLGR